MPVPPPVVTAAPNTAIACEMTSLSNGTCHIGYGASADGSGWTWMNAGISAAGPPVTATNEIAPSVPGTYYYGARWSDGLFTYYAWDSSGQTNQTSMAAVYQVVITNPVAVPPLVITEVMSNSSNENTKVNGDWFEIFNTGDTDIDLADYSWDDDSAVPGTAVFPTGTVVGAHGTLIVSDETIGSEQFFIDGWDMASHGDTNVLDMGGTVPGLNSGGDTVYLYTPGGAEITSASFGSATKGYSFSWDIYGMYIGLSEAGVNGAWKQPGDGEGGPGMDVGSPGVVVPEPGLIGALVCTAALLLRRR